MLTFLLMGISGQKWPIYTNWTAPASACLQGILIRLEMLLFHPSSLEFQTSNNGRISGLFSSPKSEFSTSCQRLIPLNFHHIGDVIPVVFTRLLKVNFCMRFFYEVSSFPYRLFAESQPLFLTLFLPMILSVRKENLIFALRCIRSIS